MSVWGTLADRFEGSEDRKHRLLSIDGGGIRGVLALEILARLEDQLRDASGAGPDFRLCDFFDYIAGTSTGAVVATGLATGLSARELLAFYEDFGPRVFKFGLHLKVLSSAYDDAPIRAEIQNLVGVERTLEPHHLRTLLLAVTHNRTSQSPWPISSNPQARYNDISRPDSNLRIPLWQIVRASTAAPTVFPPEVIQWNPDDAGSAFIFEDGGVTPYNNPAWLLYRMATEPGYRLGWATGEDKMLLISIGTGAAPRVEDGLDDLDQNYAENALRIPGALIQGAIVDQDTSCRQIGRCVHGAAIDSEIGDMIPRDEAGAPVPLEQDLGRRFLYARYTADLSQRGLDAMGLDDIRADDVRRLNSVDHIEDLCRIGRSVANEVDIAHFGELAP